MEVRKVKNKTGEILTTKEGTELEELRFEPGDEFIPEFNSVMEKTNEHTNDKGELKKITNYTLKCKARDKNAQPIFHRESEELFVTLTPAQAKSLKKKIEEGIELNQNMFVVYNYESKEYGTQIGVGLKKSHKPPKSFDSFKAEE